MSLSEMKGAGPTTGASLGGFWTRATAGAKPEGGAGPELTVGSFWGLGLTMVLDSSSCSCEPGESISSLLQDSDLLTISSGSHFLTRASKLKL